jgi:hypothetical protein
MLAIAAKAGAKEPRHLLRDVIQILV